MADNAGSSSNDVNSRHSSDTEMMVKSKRPKISKERKVSERQKIKMKAQRTKKQHCKHHRCHLSYRHKNPTISRGDLCSTRKRRHSPFSNSSGTSSEREGNSDVHTDADNVTSDENYSEQESNSREVPKEFKSSSRHKRKRAKLSPTSTRNSQLRAAFRKHFGDLVLLISNPELLATQLYSKSLISSATLDEIMTLPTSRLKKVMYLLVGLERKIQVHPEKLFIFIYVMERDPSLKDIVKQMLGTSDFRIFNSHIVCEAHCFFSWQCL